MSAYRIASIAGACTATLPSPPCCTCTTHSWTGQPLLLHQQVSEVTKALADLFVHWRPLCTTGALLSAALLHRASESSLSNYYILVPTTTR
jgi:hypothetical protein